MAVRPDRPFGPPNRPRARPAARGDSARPAASRSRRAAFAPCPPRRPGFPLRSRDRAPS